MSRWIQNPEPPYQLIERDLYVEPEKKVGCFIQGDIESFVSPIDGKVISDRKQYREHCQRHGVVNAAEFSPEYYARKAKERQEALYSKEERFKTKRMMNELFNKYERM